MKSLITMKKGKHHLVSLFRANALTAVLATALVSGLPAQAQEPQAVKYTAPSWYFGFAAGANFNFYNGSTQKLNNDLTVPAVFHEGFGVGLYVAPLVEFYRPNSMFGFMFQAGVDSRRGTFNTVPSPCNCPTELSTNLSYLTVEPSLRFAPFRGNFYLFGGPRVAFLMTNDFTYTLGINPAFPDQTPTPDVNGEFSDMNDLLVSMQIGAGYDIPLSSAYNKTQFVLSPFVSFHPYFGQDPRSVETWNITTVRAGVALKLGRGRAIETENGAVVIYPAEKSTVGFTVNAPKNVPTKRTVRESFPLRNYVFFDFGSTEIPKRYATLKKSEVADFKETDVKSTKADNEKGRSDRQMAVYYNVLNILGVRMQQNPNTKVSLVGSSESGPADGKEMAESVKEYLVDIFDINQSRIATSGRDKPVLPSEKPGATNELELLREGDRRVTIESASPELLMEFNGAPGAPFKAIEIVDVQEAPIESYVTFNVDTEKDNIESWRLEIEDKNKKVQKFGPYTADMIAIPGKSILGNNPEGDYTVRMIAITKNGQTLEKSTNVHMVLWTPPVTEEMTRYSVLYEFDDAESIKQYQDYLANVVAPKIPQNGTVIIHGHTDAIGDDAYNTNLSKQRAQNVKEMLVDALAKKGRKDVKFEVYGFGEDQGLAPFDNKLPEERFYNRTVIIDILPAK
jgi:outer membrane protein OmpA-like peptidoglycan-associated protein